MPLRFVDYVPSFIIDAGNFMNKIFSTKISKEGCYKNAHAEKWRATKLHVLFGY